MPKQQRMYSKKMSLKEQCKVQMKSSTREKSAVEKKIKGNSIKESASIDTPIKSSPIKSDSIKGSSMNSRSSKPEIKKTVKKTDHQKTVQFNGNGEIVFESLIVKNEMNGKYYLQTSDIDSTVRYDITTKEKSRMIIGGKEDTVKIDSECTISGISYKITGSEMYDWYDFGELKNGLTFIGISIPGFLDIECETEGKKVGNVDLTKGNLEIGSGISIDKNSHFNCNQITLYGTTNEN